MQPARRHVSVIGATNRPDALDSALRRAGRFDREISLGVPSATAREAILRVVTRGLRVDGSLDISAIARLTPGYVGADLAALASEAASAAVQRAFLAYRAWSACALNTAPVVRMKTIPNPPTAAPQTSTNGGCGLGGDVTHVSGSENMDIDFAPVERLLPDDEPAQLATAEPSVASKEDDRAKFSREELQGLAISMADFEVAVAKVQPSLRREGFTTKPDVTWQDVVCSMLHLYVQSCFKKLCMSYFFLMRRTELKVRCSRLRSNMQHVNMNMKKHMHDADGYQMCRAALKMSGRSSILPSRSQFAFQSGTDASASQQQQVCCFLGLLAAERR